MALTACAALIVLLAPALAVGAVSVSRAELSGGNLRVEGSGAVPNATVTVNGGAQVASARAGSSGSFRVEASGYSSPSCLATVSDGSTSAQRTLSGCTPTAPPPTTIAAPTLVSPGAGASVGQPVTLSWGAVTGAVDYTVQVSTSSTFGTLLEQRFGISGTSVTLSGLPVGVIHWRVNAVTGWVGSTPPATSAWSAPRSIQVTAQASNAPAAPVISSPTSPASFHPFQRFTVRWAAVPGAASYVVEHDDEPTFAPPLTYGNVSVTVPEFSVLYGGTASMHLRVRSVAADGSRSLPSAPVAVTLRYDAPIPPAPSLLAPVAGASVGLPVAFDWTDVADSDAYELQIDDEPGFTGDCGSILLCVRGITAASAHTITSLTAGTRYWRVRSYHGESAPGAAAVTAWSAPRSFTVAATPPAISAYSLVIYHNGLVPTGGNEVYSGTTGWNEAFGRIQLNAPAPAGGTLVALASANPAVAAVPASITVPAGEATYTFRIQPGEVFTPTPVTLSASLAGGPANQTQIIVRPSSLHSVKVPFVTGSGNFPGGVQVIGDLSLNGLAPAVGEQVTLTSSNPAAASVTPSITVAAPMWSASYPVQTHPVSSLQSVTLTATWRGASVSNTFTVHPPATLTAPANGASFALGQLVRFTWTSTGNFGWDIQIDDSSAFAAPILVERNTSSSQWFESSTLPSGTLHWRVRPRDAFGSPGPWSEVRTLTVAGATGPLAAPTLRFPAANARVNAGQLVSFSWDPVAGAGSYELQVDNASSFSLPLTLGAAGLTATSYPTSSLPRSRLWWRVRAVTPGGQPGAWSTVRQLEVR